MKVLNPKSLELNLLQLPHIKRIGRNRFIRNVLNAIGNSADPSLRPVAEGLVADPDPVVAEAARWAAGRLGAGG